jgi:Glycosyltransferase like family 2
VISFIVPFRSTEFHRVQSSEWVLKKLRQNWDYEIRIGSNMGDFNRSASRNVLVGISNADVFVFVDADSYVIKDQIEEGCESALEHGWCLPYSHYYSLTESGSRKFMANEKIGHGDDFEFIFPTTDHPIPAVGGCVIVRRDVFETVAGYDERFIGWGEEDRAFVLALETLAGPVPRVPGGIHHIWHPGYEGDCFGQPHFRDNQALCDRYREAQGNPAMMRLLVDEHR